MTGWGHNRELDREMRQLLGEMEVSSSYGSTYKFDRSRGESERIAPPGERNPDHDHWRKKYAQAETDDERKQVIDVTRVSLDAIKRRPKVPVTAVDPETARMDRICEQSIGVRDIDVVTSYGGLTLARLHKARRARNQDPLDGHPAGSGRIGDTRAEIFRLHAEGRSIRFIAMTVNMPPSSVHRMIKAGR